LFDLHRHVKAYFGEEEALMQKTGFHHYLSHAKKRKLMLEQLILMAEKVERE